MATTFLESGCDATQDLSFFPHTSTTNATVAASNTVAKDGAFSLKVTNTMAGGVGAAYTANGIVIDAGTRISFWVYFSTTTPSTNTMFFEVLNANASNTILALGLSTTGNLIALGLGANSQTGSTTLQANTWYRITFSYKITGATTWTLKIFLNGNLEVTTSNTDGSLTLETSSVAWFGTDDVGGAPFTSTSLITIYYDSIYIDNGTNIDDPGNIHVTAKLPFSNGTINGFTGSGTPSSYGSGNARYVNYRPKQTATANVNIVGAGSAVTEEYNIENQATGDVNINGATIIDYLGWLFTKALASETAKIIVNGVSSNISLTSTITLFTKIAGSSTYPAGTGSDIGEITSTTVTTVTLYDAGIVVAYIPGNKVQKLPALGVG